MQFNLCNRRIELNTNHIAGASYTLTDKTIAGFGVPLPDLGIKTRTFVRFQDRFLDSHINQTLLPFSFTANRSTFKT